MPDETYRTILESIARKKSSIVTVFAVSYTHLTLPTIYSV